LNVKLSPTLKFALATGLLAGALLGGISPAQAVGGKDGGGGNLKAALAFEGGFRGLGLAAHVSLRPDPPLVGESWLREIQYTIGPSPFAEPTGAEDDMRQYYVMRDGYRIVYLLVLGDYRFPTGKAPERSRLEALNAKLPLHQGLDDYYSGLGDKLKLQPGSKLEVHGQPVAAVNHPAETSIAYDREAWMQDSDCEKVFDPNRAVPTEDEDRCYAVAASLLGAHELLSLGGLESTGHYPYSIAMRFFLHDQDSPAIGDFAGALRKGILRYWKIDLAAGIPDLHPKSDSWLQLRLSQTPEEYDAAVDPLLKAERDIVLILARNRNATVAAELTALHRALSARVEEFNAMFIRNFTDGQKPWWGAHPSPDPQ
jgi:hypothetical protein